MGVIFLCNSFPCFRQIEKQEENNKIELVNKKLPGGQEQNCTVIASENNNNNNNSSTANSNYNNNDCNTVTQDNNNAPQQQQQQQEALFTLAPGVLYDPQMSENLSALPTSAGLRRLKRRHGYYYSSDEVLCPPPPGKSCALETDIVTHGISVSCIVYISLYTYVKFKFKL